MNNWIHVNADRIAEEFRAMGRSVEVSHSINRNNDESSYLEVTGIRRRLRISDHFSGNTDAINFPPSATAQSCLDSLARGAIISQQAEAEAERSRIEAKIAQKIADSQRAEKRVRMDTWISAQGYSQADLTAMDRNERRRIDKLAHEAIKKGDA